MKLETKFNIGDTVYYIGGSKVKSNSICRIVVEADCEVVIKYYLRTHEGYFVETDNLIFSSKADLIASL